MKRRDRSFSDGGFWRPADRTGRGRSQRQLQDRASYDYQPKRGILARLIKGNRR